MAELVVSDLVCRYDSVLAVDHVSFTVKDGEFLTLLGPSGCGKSTTLAALAGLERPDEGTIRVGSSTFFDGKSGQFVEAERRNLGLVFQSYALWPHMTVADNLAFPLKLRRIRGARRREMIREALALVEMEPYADRYPNQLSGGQQQRVALARTLVYRPQMLLLDEPLSNLDAKLRERARSWLRHLQTQVGITTIYVTHDQIEALALSDRIAVMRDGRIVQLGTPKDIYEQPADPFVADFIGTSNFLRGRIAESEDGNAVVRLPDGQTLRFALTNRIPPNAEVIIAIRPERIRPDGQGGNLLSGRVVERSYLGARFLYTIEAGGTQIRMESDAHFDNPDIRVSIPMDQVAVFQAGDTPADRKRAG